jgi:alkanesulfonate monooxygenase SsuD/methylene tetrahydromethanopterin reductase-like flavin-dependent oxidoreductase (luciferase family)
VELHLVLPAESADLPFAELQELAVQAERLGYRGVWLPDHLLPPGEYVPGSYGGVFDPLVALAALAGATSEVRIGTSVLVLPMRSPFVVA